MFGSCDDEGATVTNEPKISGNVVFQTIDPEVATQCRLAAERGHTHTVCFDSLSGRQCVTGYVGAVRNVDAGRLQWEITIRVVDVHDPASVPSAPTTA